MTQEDEDEPVPLEEGTDEDGVTLGAVTMGEVTLGEATVTVDSGTVAGFDSFVDADFFGVSGNPAVANFSAGATAIVGLGAMMSSGCTSSVSCNFTGPGNLKGSSVATVEEVVGLS